MLDFHGLRLEVSAEDPGVRATVLDRVRRLPPAPPGAADLAFGYDAAPIARPDGDGRPVYDPVRGEVLHFDSADLLYLDLGDGVRALCDPERGRVHVGAARPDPFLLSHPLFTLPLLELAKRRGLYGVHAAALARGGRGLLVAGTSGAGKSTLTIALLRGGFDYLGDDLVFLTRRDGALRGLGLAEDLDVTERTVGFWPELAAHVRDGVPGAPKRRLAPEEALGASVVSECEPRAIVFPRIAGTAKSRFETMTAGEALRELAPNVLLTERASAQAHLSALGALAASCTCVRLHTGRDFDALPDTLGALL